MCGNENQVNLTVKCGVGSLGVLDSVKSGHFPSAKDKHGFLVVGRLYSDPLWEA